MRAHRFGPFLLDWKPESSNPFLLLKEEQQDVWPKVWLLLLPALLLKSQTRVFDLGRGVLSCKEVTTLACSLCHGSLLPAPFDSGMKGLWVMNSGLSVAVFTGSPPDSTVSCLFLSSIHRPLLRNVRTSWVRFDRKYSTLVPKRCLQEGGTGKSEYWLN